LVVGFIAAQAANAAFDFVALYPVAQSTAWGGWAKQWGKEDLDRLGFPERWRFLFPIVKTSSALGLLLGGRWPRLGRITAAAVVAYFVVALGFHLRAKDRADKFGPAVAMLLWSGLVFRSFRPRPRSVATE
jgi:hypothetical protein